MAYHSPDPAIEAVLRSARAREAQGVENTQRAREEARRRAQAVPHREKAGRKKAAKRHHVERLTSVPKEPLAEWEMSAMQAKTYRALVRQTWANARELAEHLLEVDKADERQAYRACAYVGTVRGIIKPYGLDVPRGARKVGGYQQIIVRK